MKLTMENPFGFVVQNYIRNRYAFLPNVHEVVVFVVLAIMAFWWKEAKPWMITQIKWFRSFYFLHTSTDNCKGQLKIYWLPGPRPSTRARRLFFEQKTRDKDFLYYDILKIKISWIWNIFWPCNPIISERLLHENFTISFNLMLSRK